MAAERLTMRKTREILRQKWGLGLSHRQVAGSLGIGLGTVSETLTRAMVAKLGSWPEVQALDEVELEARLYGRASVAGAVRPLPDCCWIHRELRRAGVTLQLLHLEYLEGQPEGYRY